MVVASSVGRYSEVRLLSGMQPGLGLVIMDYGDKLPQVIVSFWVVEGGAALINVYFAYAGALGELLMV